MNDVQKSGLCCCHGQLSNWSLWTKTRWTSQGNDCWSANKDNHMCQCAHTHQWLWMQTGLQDDSLWLHLSVQSLECGIPNVCLTSELGLQSKQGIALALHSNGVVLTVTSEHVDRHEDEWATKSSFLAAQERNTWSPLKSTYIHTSHGDYWNRHRYIADYESGGWQGILLTETMDAVSTIEATHKSYLRLCWQKQALNGDNFRWCAYG